MRKVGASLKSWIENYLSGTTDNLKGEIEKEEAKIKGFEKKIEAILADRNLSKYVAEEHAASQKKEIRRCETKISQLKKTIETSDVKARAEKIHDLLTGNDFYTGFEIDADGYLSLFTSMLIDAERKHKIGKFRICIPKRPSSYQDFRVLNLDYQMGSLQHWAVNDSYCCMGEWSNDFQNTLSKGKLDEFFTLFINYITLSPQDNTYANKSQYYKVRTKRNAEQQKQAKEVPFSSMGSFGSGEYDYDSDTDNDEDDDEDWD